MSASTTIAESLRGTRCSGMATGPGLAAPSWRPGGRARRSVPRRTVQVRLAPVVHSALTRAAWTPTKGASPLVRVRTDTDANPGRLTGSPARTYLALLIRRAVRPTKGAHPLREPPSGVPRFAPPRRVPIALPLQWVQRDATVGYPLLLSMQWVDVTNRHESCGLVC